MAPNKQECWSLSSVIKSMESQVIYKQCGTKLLCRHYQWRRFHLRYNFACEPFFFSNFIEQMLHNFVSLNRAPLSLMYGWVWLHCECMSYRFLKIFLYFFQLNMPCLTLKINSHLNILLLVAFVSIPSSWSLTEPLRLPFSLYLFRFHLIQH